MSVAAMRHFGFERPLWQWTLTQFRRLHVMNSHAQRPRLLAFLDLGVNVADWASPLLAAHPTLQYYGVEGSPPTAALAAANMLTSALRRQEQQQQQQTRTETGAAYLIPYPLLSWRIYQLAAQAGGVCFQTIHENVGGQAVQSVHLPDCSIASTAGRAYFPQVLRTMAVQQQQQQEWPSFFIAKFDIQNFEFKVLSSATEWLQRKPPCYVLIEALNHHFNYPTTHMPALWELLLDAGYNVAWRAYNPYTFATELPGRDKPFWDASNTTIGLVQAWKQDMQGEQFLGYKDYILGFKDEQACIERLLRDD